MMLSSPRKGHPVDALHRIMNSLEHFENKLDKLQDDVKFHGQTLTELRAMVTSLSGGTIVAADVGKSEDIKRLLKKTVSNQYDVNVYLEDAKIKRKNSIPPLPAKVKEQTSLPAQKTISSKTSPIKVHGKKMEIGTKSIGPKHIQRHRKADAQRKANALRTQKIIENKRIKLTK